MFINLDKWGNSLGIRIPSHLAKELGLSQGSTVDIVREGDHLAIYPHKPKYDLKNMLEMVSDDNIHELVWKDLGSPVGKEVW